MKSMNPAFPHTSDHLVDINKKARLAEGAQHVSDAVNQSPAQQPVLPSATGRDVRALVSEAIDSAFMGDWPKPHGYAEDVHRATTMVLSALQPFIALPGQTSGEEKK